MGSRNFTRERIAHLAARLIAQDGVDDYGTAKRKAARQAGVPEARDLPNNDEIDAAIISYRALYQTEYPAQLREMRRLALELMDEFSLFTPYLTGAVLSGHAALTAGIHLQLYTDDVKAVAHELLNRGIGYRSSETRLYAGAMQITSPTLSYTRDDCEVHLTVLSTRELRMQLTGSIGGRPILRAKREAVAALLVEQ